jgi:branched-chain amino acid transport system ATP-binding protein
MTLLQVHHLVKHFDGVQAVKGVSFEVRVGECVALIGPNGAGKSTSFACIAGQQQVSGGEVLWAGERIDRMRPAQRLTRGVARTFQVAQTFEALTVLQNVQLLLQAPRGLSAFNVLNGSSAMTNSGRGQSALHAVSAEAALALLARVGLQDVALADVAGLPYGAKKRLELAMALAGVADNAAVPRLLLLDEPAAGLGGPERADLMALVKSLAHDAPGADGASSAMAVLYTEHNMDAVFGVADRVLVLIDGLLAAQGTPQEMAQHATVRTRYLGRSGTDALSARALPWRAGRGDEESSPAAALPPASPQPPSQPILAVQNLKVWYGAAQALFDVSLQVGRGELVVLQGLNGAGKSTLLQAIMGLSPRVTGAISYENNSILAWAPHTRARAGLGFVAEDRRLFTGLTVQENLQLAARGDVRANEARVLALFPALTTMLHRPAARMSGGEQQMLAIARTLMTSPKLLLLDEPCEGIAPLLVENIVAALLVLKAQGMTMLLAEQNSILAERADRVITLVAGQLTP